MNSYFCVEFFNSLKCQITESHWKIQRVLVNFQNKNPFNKISNKVLQPNAVKHQTQLIMNTDFLFEYQHILSLQTKLNSLWAEVLTTMFEQNGVTLGVIEFIWKGAKGQTIDHLWQSTHQLMPVIDGPVYRQVGSALEAVYGNNGYQCAWRVYFW